jgi:predicted permease
MAGLSGDLKFAARLFRRQAAVVSLAIVGLGVAIGVSAPVFSVAYGFNFRPLGVDDPAAVVHVSRTAVIDGKERRGWTFSNYVRMRDASRLVRLEAVVPRTVSISTTPGAAGGPPIDIRFVTGTLAATFGGRTFAGRPVEPSDDVPGAPPVATLHYAFWMNQLNGDRAIVGRALYFNGAPVTVAGIFDRRFTGPFETIGTPGALLSLASAATVAPREGPFTSTSSAGVEVIGRLERGVTMAQAEAEAQAIAVNLGWTTDVRASASQMVRFRPAGNEFTDDDLQMSAIFITIVGLVLLLAATNVANLLLAGAISRQPEIAARLALGAGRARILRQLVTESTLLGVIAGLAGLVLSLWVTPFVAATLYIPPAIDLGPDIPLFVFISMLSVLAGVAAGLAPARFGARADVAPVLKGGTPQAGTSPRARRLRATFLGIQAATSVMLLVLTALFVRSLVQASHPQLGVDVDQLLTVSATNRSAPGDVSPQSFWDAARARIRSLPGVENAALVTSSPFGALPGPAVVAHDGRRYRVDQDATSPEFFEIFRMTFVAGRPYTPAETAEGAPVAVITATLAREFFPDGDALGSTLDRIHPSYRHLRVIGIVADPPRTLRSPRQGERSGAVFRPPIKSDRLRMIVLTREHARLASESVRSSIAAIDSALDVNVALVRDDLDRRLAAPRILAAIAGVVGGLALVLSVIGMLGVTCVIAGQRRREIGVRLAIGANHSEVIWMIFRQGMRPVVIGLVIGIGLALMGTRVVGSYLIGGVSARDPLAFAVAAAVLLASAALGILIAAGRGARVDPVAVLREP